MACDDVTTGNDQDIARADLDLDIGRSARTAVLRQVLVKGAPRCTLQVHPVDADRLGLTPGGRVRITSRVGSVDAPVEVTDAVRPGVVSLAHGWGHGHPHTRLRVAAERAGVNSNILTDAAAIDPLSGTSVLNGIPVTVEAA